jgi:hypothetical protein
LDVTNRLHGNHTFPLPRILEADNIRVELAEDFLVKSTSILAAFLVALSLITTGCGTSDSVKSITVTTNSTSSGGFFNLPGEGATLQLIATANYNSGKTVDVTNESTFAATVTAGSTGNFGTLATPPNTVTINATGLMAAVLPFDCTWTDTTPPPATTATWLLTGSYTVIATYKGMASQPIFVGVGSASGNGPGGACGPA